MPAGKTLDTFDFTAVPMISKAHVQALAAGDAWLEKGANLLCFGPPAAGKTHLAGGAGSGLDRKGLARPVCSDHGSWEEQIFARDLALFEAAIAKLDKYDLLRSSTISPMSPRTKRRRAFCSN